MRTSLALQRRGGVGADLHARGAGGEFSGIAPDVGRFRDVQRGGDRGLRIRAARFQERASHASSRARDREADRAHLRGAAPAADSVGPPSTRTSLSSWKCTVNLFCSTSLPRISLRK